MQNNSEKEELEERVRNLEDFSEKTFEVINNILNSLGISFVANKQGPPNVKILIPKKGQFAGILSKLYLDVQELKKQTPKNGIILPR